MGMDEAGDYGENSTLPQSEIIQPKITIIINI